MTRALVRSIVLLAAFATCHHEPRERVPAFIEPVELPDDRVVLTEIQEALGKHDRAQADRMLDAHDPGELVEHATVSQVALDRGVMTSADLLRIGDDMFAYQFRPENGLGNGRAGRRPPNLRRVADGEVGGPEAMACADCHSVGGDDGAGSLTQNVFARGDGDRTSSGDVRSAPAVLGLGPIQRLAEELTSSLATARADAIVRARAHHEPVTIALVAKGLAFGTLVVRPDGSVDTSAVVGVAPDLVVRPFGWKGHQATLRGMIREAFRLHLGMIAMVDQERVRAGQLAPAIYGEGPWPDVDADGVTIEVEDGMVSTMVTYLAQLEVPVVRPPDEPGLRARFARGQRAFGDLGCARCHTPSLPLDDPHLTTAPEELAHVGGRAITIDVARDGLAPKITATARGYEVALFSDLRRHDLGDELAAPRSQPADGGDVAARIWLTRALWGLADSAPYLHDGRAPTVDAAIRAHGGEAEAVRTAYATAAPELRAD
ncbi:MAG: hypothetical protein NT062_16420, partial [Proteobacteria bacterium]|nr:hypothetical protein [Pseudomonadota bacterium]